MKGATVQLSDLCDLISESVKPGERPDALYLGLEHLASGRLVCTGGGRASHMRSNTSAFRSGDVLYGKLRPYLDKAILADEPGVCTTELLVLRAKIGVDARFLAALVHSTSFLEHSVAGTTGVQHPRTSWAHIRDFETPAFASDDQRQIADLLWLVHEAITQSEKLAVETQTLKRAAMQTLFTRGLRGEAQKDTEIGPVPESWEVRPLVSLCENADSVDLKSESDRVIEYVDVSAVSRESLQIESTASFKLKDAPGRARKRILKGDVIFATVRPSLLRTAVVPQELDNQVCSTAFCVLRENRERTAEGFIRYVVQRERFVQQLAAIETGASYPAVTDRIVKEQLVPVPSLGEQWEITDVLSSIDSKIDLHQRKQALLEELFKALLHKLMTGEIRVEDLCLSALTAENYQVHIKETGRLQCHE